MASARGPSRPRGLKPAAAPTGRVARCRPGDRGERGCERGCEYISKSTDGCERAVARTDVSATRCAPATAHRTLMHSAQSCRKALKHLAQRKDGAALYAARCPAFLPLLTRHFGHVTFFPVTRPSPLVWGAETATATRGLTFKSRRSRASAPRRAGHPAVVPFTVRRAHRRRARPTGPVADARALRRVLRARSAVPQSSLDAVSPARSGARLLPLGAFAGRAHVRNCRALVCALRRSVPAGAPHALQ